MENGEKNATFVIVDSHSLLHRAYPAIIFASLKPTGLRQVVRKFPKDL